MFFLVREYLYQRPCTDPWRCMCIDWFWLPIFRTNLFREIRNKDMKIQIREQFWDKLLPYLLVNPAINISLLHTHTSCLCLHTNTHSFTHMHAHTHTLHGAKKDAFRDPRSTFVWMLIAQTHFVRDVRRIDFLACAVCIIDKASHHMMTKIIVDVPVPTNSRVNAPFHHTARADVRIFCDAFMYQ